MSIQNPAPKILIIGAGLAGLALAQGLKRAQPAIPFRIFERDSSATFRAQGYRIRITPKGAAALSRLLPTPLFTAFEKTSGRLAQEGHRLLALDGTEADWPAGPRPPPGPGKAYNADRAVLRNILLSGVEEEVSFGRRFESYKVKDDGTIEVHFAGGSTEVGSLLIGADGATLPRAPTAPPRL